MKNIYVILLIVVVIGIIAIISLTFLTTTDQNLTGAAIWSGCKCTGADEGCCQAIGGCDSSKNCKACGGSCQSLD